MLPKNEEYKKIRVESIKNNNRKLYDKLTKEASKKAREDKNVLSVYGSVDPKYFDIGLGKAYVRVFKNYIS